MIPLCGFSFSLLPGTTRAQQKKPAGLKPTDFQALEWNPIQMRRAGAHSNKSDKY